MAIIFAGSELGDFENNSGSTCTAEISLSGKANSSYVRACIRIGAGGMCTSRFTGAPTTVWFQGFLSRGGMTGGSGTQMQLGKFSTGIPLVKLIHASFNAVKLQRWNGSAYVDVGSNVILTGAVDQYVTIEATIHASAGAIRWYFNGTQQAEYTGDTTQSGASFDWATINSYSDNDAVSYWSEVLIATTDPRGKRVKTLPATGNGANTAWTGDYTGIDENGADDTDGVTSTTAGQKETFTCAGTPSGVVAVNAVVLNIRGCRGSTGPQNVDGIIRRGSTDYFSSAPQPGLSVPTPKCVVFENDPSTSAAWATSGVSFEFGVRSAA